MKDQQQKRRRELREVHTHTHGRTEWSWDSDNCQLIEDSNILVTQLYHSSQLVIHATGSGHTIGLNLEREREKGEEEKMQVTRGERDVISLSHALTRNNRWHGQMQLQLLVMAVVPAEGEVSE